MFRVSQYPSSGVLKTVTAVSGTGHNTGTATSLQRGLIRPRWIDFEVNKYLHIFASGWIFINIELCLDYIFINSFREITGLSMDVKCVMNRV